MHIELSSDAVQFIEGLVASGQYKSADEAVAEGLRLLMSRQHLRADIQKDIDELDAGQGIVGDVVIAELRERARKPTESWAQPRKRCCSVDLILLPEDFTKQPG